MRFKALLAMISISFCLHTAAAQQQTKERGAFGDSEYKLGPEDVIEVFVYQEKDASTTVVVRPDGKVSLPLIGELPASGKTAAQLEKEVTQKLTKFYAEPAVNVIVKEVRSPKVSVLGEVKNPNVYPIRDRATILDVIAQAGGFTEYANPKKVIVVREQQRITLNVDDLIKKSKGNTFYVLPYDKVFVQ